MTLDTWHLTPYKLHMTPDMWHQTPDTMTHETWLVGGFGALPVAFSDIWQVTPDTWHMTHDRCHITSDTWHITHDKWHVISDTMTHDHCFHDQVITPLPGVPLKLPLHLVVICQNFGNFANFHVFHHYVTDSACPTRSHRLLFSLASATLCIHQF